MRKQRARDGGDGGSESKCSDLHRRGVDADEFGGRFVVVHRAHFEPQARAFDHEYEDKDSNGPNPNIESGYMWHPSVAARATERPKAQEEAAYHLPETEGRHREIDALQPQGRKTDYHSHDARKQ